MLNSVYVLEEFGIYMYMNIEHIENVEFWPNVAFCTWTISNLCWWLTIADTTNVVTTIKLDEIVCADVCGKMERTNEKLRQNIHGACRIGNGYWREILMHATTELVKWPKALGYQYLDRNTMKTPWAGCWQCEFHSNTCATFTHTHLHSILIYVYTV